MSRRGSSAAQAPSPEEFAGLLDELPGVGELLDRAANRRCAAGNLVGSSAALFAVALARRSGRPLLLVTSTVGEAQGLADDAAAFAPDLDVAYLPTAEESGFLREAERSVLGRRVEVGRMLAEPGPGAALVIASAAALLEDLPAPDEVREASVEIRVGESRDRDRLVEALVGAGFERVHLVERPGQVSARGEIVDVFDALASRPYRIELFGDEVDSIRVFDMESQRSIERLDRITLSTLLPATAETGGSPMLEHLSGEVLVALRDRADVEQAIRRHVERTDAGADPGLVGRLLERGTVDLDRLPVDPALGIDLPCGGIEARGSDMAGAIATLEALSDEGRRVVVGFATEAERDRFHAAVREEADETLADDLAGRAVRSIVGTFFRGFRLTSLGVVLVNHRELFDIGVSRRAKVRPVERPQSRPIDDFVDLAEGDFVVHVAHGIGRFLGIQTMEKAGENQEFLVLEFRDEVLLYVPAAKADLVQKYIGGKGEGGPKLSKIGGRSWSRKKEEVYRAVADLAADMLETQAARERGEGFAHPPEGPWQHEFEAAFPYEETPDQLSAIEAVREDMEAPRPMDRLICGDVGYGKTEIAMRAAFKSVTAGKQVAVLVPTTVLAEQHFLSFRERMADWPVRIESLSRFRSRREQQETVLGLVEGEVDIVIGTHRLLSKDVAFKDLGLVVIDEEQRFGVAHKERLRTLRRKVDIMTLTATPIPRTLHLSLLGIRDISALTQAPRGRQPVETRIVRFEEGLVRNAVLFELERGGQCYFVHNRVQTIERVRRELAALVPEARTLVIHGQMKPEEVERNLLAFVKRDADILLATTIIESGIDIPNSNTIFIDRPEMYGLADLHQLRGRVGRQSAKAHAWLLLRPDTILTGDAEKRLRAIEEFDELGSGFRIAMRDLEIRGAGNLLGAEQHGHIAAVGYDMYCRLLEAAVKQLKKQKVVLPDEIDLNLDFDCALPGTYVADPRAKLEMYRKLGRATSPRDFADLVAEMEDRFGRLPPMAADFVDVCRVRALAEKLRLRRVAVSRGRGLLLRPDDPRDARRRLHVTGVPHRVIQEKEFLLVHPEDFGRPGEVLELMRRALLPGSRRGEEDVARDPRTG